LDKYLSKDFTGVKGESKRYFTSHAQTRHGLKKNMGRKLVDGFYKNMFMNPIYSSIYKLRERRHGF